MKKRTRSLELQPLDKPTDEWLAQNGWKLEPRDVDSDAVPVVRNLTGNALDRYRHRGELATDRLDNERLWLAGDRLRNDWETARLTLMAQPQMEMGRIEGGTESFSEARLDARARVNAAMVAMGPTKDCVVDCCVFGVPARGRIEILRLGLSALAESYGFR